MATQKFSVTAVSPMVAARFKELKLKASHQISSQNAVTTNTVRPGTPAPQVLGALAPDANVTQQENQVPQDALQAFFDVNDTNSLSQQKEIVKNEVADRNYEYHIAMLASMDATDLKKENVIFFQLSLLMEARRHFLMHNTKPAVIDEDVKAQRGRILEQASSMTSIAEEAKELNIKIKKQTSSFSFFYPNITLPEFWRVQSSQRRVKYPSSANPNRFLNLARIYADIDMQMTNRIKPWLENIKRSVINAAFSKCFFSSDEAERKLQCNAIDAVFLLIEADARTIFKAYNNIDRAINSIKDDPFLNSHNQMHSKTFKAQLLQLLAIVDYGAQNNLSQSP